MTSFLIISGVIGFGIIFILCVSVNSVHPLPRVTKLIVFAAFTDPEIVTKVSVDKDALPTSYQLGIVGEIVEPEAVIVNPGSRSRISRRVAPPPNLKVIGSIASPAQTSCEEDPISCLKVGWGKTSIVATLV